MSHLRKIPLGSVLALAACLIAVLALSAPAAGEEPKKPMELKDDAKAVPSARTIDFAADLGLDFGTLKSLGQRIEQARETPDPVGLALAAQELGVAEKVSKKQAGLKSGDLLNEAVAMGLRRAQPEELNALALVVTDDKAKGTLQKAATEAQKIAGERGRGVGTLTVFNNSDRVVAIYVNDRFVGNVSAHNEKSFEIGELMANIADLEGPLTTKIQARSGKWRWPARPEGLLVSKDVPNYKWTLNPIPE